MQKVVFSFEFLVLSASHPFQNSGGVGGNSKFKIQNSKFS